MTTNIFIIRGDVFLLYDMVYNKNICCHYTLSYIMTTNILLYVKMYFYYMIWCIIKYLLSLYKKVYNDNKYFIVREDVFLLYEKMYNDNKYFYYTRRCIIKIFVVII